MRLPTVSWFICQQRMKPVTEVYLLMEAAADGISEVMKNWMKKHRISSVWNTNQKQNWTMRNISKSITMIRM